MSKKIYVADLQPYYSKQQSFYGKAKVYQDGEWYILVSYSTEVAKVNINDTKIVEIYDQFSYTTSKHIRDFIGQYSAYPYFSLFKDLEKALNCEDYFV